jgi:hypothetical protein
MQTHEVAHPALENDDASTEIQAQLPPKYRSTHAESCPTLDGNKHM